MNRISQKPNHFVASAHKISVVHDLLPLIWFKINLVPGEQNVMKLKL